MCLKCNGLGKVNKINLESIIPDNNISIHGGGIIPIGGYKTAGYLNSYLQFLIDIILI